MRAPLRLHHSAPLLARSVSASAAAAHKTVHLLRHGVTEMNEYLAANQYDAPDFRDPLLFDTRLTPAGLRQAASVAARTAWLKPQLIVASPLTRALHTAELAFGGAAGVPRTVTRLATERLYHSSDCGRHPAVVASEFATWSGFDQLQPVWWHSPDGSSHAVELEPEEAFLERCRLLLAWLAERPESSIAVVTHWGVLKALTGAEFANCELRTMRLGDLAVRGV